MMIMNEEPEEIWKETDVACFRLLSGIRLDRLRKTMRHTGQDSGWVSCRGFVSFLGTKGSFLGGKEAGAWR
jgi:hypothetical protein